MRWLGLRGGADARGVDIIQHAMVTAAARGQSHHGGGDHTGTIRAKKVGLAVAGHSVHFAAMAGFGCRLKRTVLQALVSEPLKPALDTVVTSGAVHFNQPVR